MEPVEFELKKTLARRQPPPDFTVRLMRRVRAEPPQRPMPWRPMPWRWVAVGAMAASLSFGFFMHSNKQAAADQRAEADLILSLQLAGVTINQARDAVIRPRVQELQP